MFKLIFGLIIVGCIGVLLYSAWQKRKEEEEREDLHEELDGVNKDLRKVNVEEDVVDAKVKLKGRKAEVAEKAKVLDDDAPAAAPKKKTAKKKGNT